MQSDGRHSTIQPARRSERGWRPQQELRKGRLEMRFWGFAALPKWRRRPRHACGPWGRSAGARQRNINVSSNPQRPGTSVRPVSGNAPFAALFRLSCKVRCTTTVASGGRPTVRTHVRLQANANGTADRRRRPDDRLRHARRVRARARWEHSSELRDPPSPPDPHSLLGAAAARRRSSLRPGLRPLQLLGSGAVRGRPPGGAFP